MAQQVGQISCKSESVTSIVLVELMWNHPKIEDKKVQSPMFRNDECNRGTFYLDEKEKEQISDPI